MESPLTILAPTLASCVRAAQKLTGRRATSGWASDERPLDQVPFLTLRDVLRHFALDPNRLYWLGILPDQKPNLRVTKEDHTDRLDVESRRRADEFFEICAVLISASLIQSSELPDEQAPADPEDAARWLRSALDLPQEPLPNIRERLEASGVLVVGRAMVDISGMSAWITLPDRASVPCILLNARHGEGRRNFTLVHELGHLIRRQPSTACRLKIPLSTDNRLTDERWCDRFAAEILLPERWMGWKSLGSDIARLSPSQRPAYLSDAARTFGVSIEALTWRLLRLGRIDATWARAFLRAKRSGRAKARPLAPRDVLGTRSRATFDAILQGQISESYGRYIFGRSFDRFEGTEPITQPASITH
jgi:Zn-dependent peptidase ImmA (M78 family)